MEFSPEKSSAGWSSILKALCILCCGLVTSGALSGCASYNLTRGQCAAIGAALGAGAGAGIGIAINENTGDHESGVAASLGGAAGLVVGGITG